MELLLLLGVGAALLLSSQNDGNQFQHVKGVLKVAVDQDVSRGAPAVSDGWMNQLAMAWIRGDANELRGIADGLRASFPETSQVVALEWRRRTGR